MCGANITPFSPNTIPEITFATKNTFALINSCQY